MLSAFVRREPCANPAARPGYPRPDGVAPLPPPVRLLYAAAGCLVVAQLVGIYGLITRKADLVFAILTIGLVLAAAALAALYGYHRLG